MLVFVNSVSTLLVTKSPLGTPGLESTGLEKPAERESVFSNNASKSTGPDSSDCIFFWSSHCGQGDSTANGPVIPTPCWAGRVVGTPWTTWIENMNQKLKALTKHKRNRCWPDTHYRWPLQLFMHQHAIAITGEGRVCRTWEDMDEEKSCFYLWEGKSGTIR